MSVSALIAMRLPIFSESDTRSGSTGCLDCRDEPDGVARPRGALITTKSTARTMRLRIIESTLGTESQSPRGCDCTSRRFQRSFDPINRHVLYLTYAEASCGATNNPVNGNPSSWRGCFPKTPGHTANRFREAAFCSMRKDRSGARV